MFQQPDKDPSEGTPALVDPTAEPAIPIVIVPLHELIVLPGAGTVIIELTPALSISVAPSGMVPPLRVNPLDPGIESGEAVPLDKTAEEDVQFDVEAAEPAASSPPPSKVELPAPVVPQLEPAAGLKPPGLISVAPSGIPVPFDPLDPLVPGVPSGEVVPMAEVPVAVCP
jgi:hypothetical protein